jgi:hypothetical protein
MFNVVENRRAAFAFARVLLVCSLFAIGFTPAANADAQSYQYTITFTSAPEYGDGLSFNMALSFVTSGLLGSGTTNIDPNSVVVLAAPLNDSSLVSLTANNGEFHASFVGQACPGCGYLPGQFERDDSYSDFLQNPITAPGTYQPFISEVVDATHTTSPPSESFQDFLNHGGFGDSVSVVATPEPNTGSLVGACFLCCLMIVLLRRSA